MPTFAALLYTEDVDWSAPEQAEAMADYRRFGTDAESAITGGAVLYQTATATTVRVIGGRGGDTVVSDGPYAETKEALTGFYLLDAADLDAAVALAARIPAAWGPGGVEVRPLIPRPGS